MTVIPSPGLILPVSDRVDLVQGNPPLSSPGIARIAMIAGVPSVSINGGAYASFGSGGAAPTGCLLSQSILPASDRLDIIMGNPPVSPAGAGRLAVIGGVVSLSIEGAAYASLGASGAAPSGVAIFPDALPPTGWIDIIQGNPPVSPAGIARIACFPGATTLSISINGAAYVTLGNTPPGSPTLNFDASNLDGSNNSTLTSGSQFGTANNLGSAGAAGNAVQATGANKPTFQSDIGGLPAIQFSGGQWLSSGAITPFTQPSIIGIVVRSNTLPAVEFFCDGRVGGGNARQTILQESGTAQMASNSIVSDGTMTAGKFAIIICNFNGASSSLQLDGATTSGLNPGTFALDGITLGASNAGTGPMTGYLRQLIAYTGAGQPTAAQLLTALQAKWGVTPN